MKIDLELKFKVNDDNISTKYGLGASVYLCMRHATLRALQGQYIETEIDSYGTETDMRRHFLCYDCDPTEYDI